MIAFCTHCWAEVDSDDRLCACCGADFHADSRSYEEKLTAALGHPLPQARVRVCWLLGEKYIVAAVPQLIELVKYDQDLFVQRAAILALGKLRDSRALPLLKSINQGQNRFLRIAASESLANIGL